MSAVDEEEDIILFTCTRSRIKKRCNIALTLVLFVFKYNSKQTYDEEKVSKHSHRFREQDKDRTIMMADERREAFIAYLTMHKTLFTR
jgi:hypothetical protein